MPQRTYFEVDNQMTTIRQGGTTRLEMKLVGDGREMTFTGAFTDVNGCRQHYEGTATGGYIAVHGSKFLGGLVGDGHMTAEGIRPLIDLVLTWGLNEV